MPRAKSLLHFWGVRGSIAAPGNLTVKTGGNTACVELRHNDYSLVFDAGTGLRGLGQRLASRNGLELTILLSHYHWDHLLGLPFFGPIFKPDSRITVYGELGEGGGGPEAAVRKQFSAPSFPIVYESLGAKLDFHTVYPGDTFTIAGMKVTVGKLNHPQGAICYRVEFGNRVIVYASDHEHDGEGDKGLIEFAQKADVLVYDAMYTDESYAQGKKGWGHSTWQEGVRVAKAAKCKKLFLFHHDPVHDDKKMNAIEKAAQKVFTKAFVAREGLEVTL